MGLNLKEINSRELLSSKTWGDACREDSEAKPFWIELYQRITSLLPKFLPLATPRRFACPRRFGWMR